MHSDGLIYSDTGTGKGITFGDVNYVLGTWHTDLAKLCGDTRINMWAKRKPVRHTSVAPLTDAQRMAVNYGLSVTPVTTIQGLTAKYGAQRTSCFANDKVRPGTDWSRLSDFDGYHHYSVSPLGESLQTPAPMVKGPDLTVQILGFPTSVWNLSISDIRLNSSESTYDTELSDMYFGAYVDGVGLFTSLTKVVTQGQGGQVITMHITIDSDLIGVCSGKAVYPCLCDQGGLTAYNGGGIRLLDIPGVPSGSVTITPDIEIDAMRSTALLNSSGRVRVTLSVNNYSYERVFSSSDCYLSLRNGGVEMARYSIGFTASAGTPGAHVTTIYGPEDYWPSGVTEYWDCLVHIQDGSDTWETALMIRNE